MGLKLWHTPTRNIVLKEAEEGFLEKNNISESHDLDAFAGPPPPSASLRAGMSDAKDQGSAGTCTSFGVVSCLDYFHGKVDLSEGHLTHGAEKQFGDCSEGLALEHAMAYARDTGVVTEVDWRYDAAQICWVDPPQTSSKQHFRFTQVRVVFQRPSAAVIGLMDAQLRGDASIAFGASSMMYSQAQEGGMPANFVNLLKAAIAKAHTPVAVSVPVWFKSKGKLDAGWDWGPNIQMPTPVNLRLFLEISSVPGGAGWHVIAIDGYDDAVQRFTFKNSWDWWWGDNGFGTIPYEYVTAYARLAMHGWV